jgi:hypothetical protein
MKPIRYVFPGLCSLALVSGPMLNALASGAPDESWQIVPEETLSDLRGGLDLGPLIGSFAIQRVVEVNGEVVARMQIVISNLNRLGQGGMPTISISGPLAQLIQVFNPAGVSASLPTNSSSTVRTNPTSSAAPASPPANSAATAATASTNNPAPQSSTPAGSSPGSAATVATNNGPHIGSTSGNTGTTSATGTQTGSTAQFGAAISQAVAAANGATSANAAAPPSAARASASQTSTAPVASTTAAAAASTAAAASAANPAQSFTRTIPVGNTGNVIVVSNIPNATAISSEVQNSVQATRVQTLTTITATLNSLQLLNAAAIANAVRQQIASGH